MTEPRRYNEWAGNPQGDPENTQHCVATVRDRTQRWAHYIQCSRPRGHGSDGLYCKQHAKKATP